MLRRNKNNAGDNSQSISRVKQGYSSSSRSSSNCNPHRYLPVLNNNRFISNPHHRRFHLADRGTPYCRREDMYLPTHRRRWAMCRRRVMVHFRKGQEEEQQEEEQEEEEEEEQEDIIWQHHRVMDCHRVMDYRSKGKLKLVTL